MSGSHDKQSGARPFVIAAYHPDDQGALHPDLPDVGWCAGGSGERCRLWHDHRRPRTTGPCFPLTVLRCALHKRAFTVYPPGYAPYARAPVAAVSPDGGYLQSQTQSAAERFRGTLFEAALDAADGKAWPRENYGPPQRWWWGTQLRLLALATQLVGVAAKMTAKRREQIAQTLGVDVLTLHEQAEKLRKQDGYQERGKAVRIVLACLSTQHFLPERLLECGYLIEHWGPSYRWLSQLRSLRRLPFRPAPGTRRATRPP
jgi:hypothetical protein